MIGGNTQGGSIHEFYLPKNTPRLPTVTHGEGIYLYTSDGRKLLDGSSGPIAINVGYGNNRIISALHDQAAKTPFASYRSFETSANVELSDKLCSLCGPGYDRAFFVSGGSEAIECCIKLLRNWAVAKGEPKRWKIISRMPSYHGSTLGALSITGDPVAHEMYGPMMASQPKVPTPFTYRIPSPFTTPAEYSAECLRQLEATIVSEGPETILGFIMEPVGGLATGALVAPDAYCKGVRELCYKYKIILVFDEVMTGAGRTGKFLAAHWWPDAKPDVVVMAKGLSSGYIPLGAVVAPNWIVQTITDKMGGFNHGHTYTSTPLQCAVASACLDVLIDDGLMENCCRMGDELLSTLLAVQSRTKTVGDVRGKGLLMAVEIVKDSDTKEMWDMGVRAAYRIATKAEARGVVLYVRVTANGAFGQWIMVAPPLIVTKSEIEFIGNVIEESVKEFELEMGL
ncbi:aminotransferase [Gonapodya prolifera JEL478]|uniref:Aminotransferase n=1 Tax=Gonapodya prolifera (strain JEL478) TaxID=1344416 RepID=A0A138ZZL3_GONPJ|nr:aminotransferase [Gonapodya prolifera JEL478]|eukprot:KXS09946.1 aminotransferase [Gonapodya prolifera JEL478]